MKNLIAAARSKAFGLLVVTGLAAASFTGTAYSATLGEAFTFSVADAFTGASGVGTHYHSSTGGDFGNPAGLAEVGRLGTGNEEVRGLSEFDISAGLDPFTTAFLTFEVNQLGGLFGQANYSGPITISSYQANNAEDLSDFQIVPSGTVATFNTTGLGVGNILSFDVTTILMTALGNSDTSIGFRLQMDPLIPDSLAIVFNDFVLTTDDLTTVPLPAALPLLLSALGFFGFMGWRRKRLAAA